MKVGEVELVDIVDYLFGFCERVQAVHRAHAPAVYCDAELRYGAVCDGHGDGLPACIRVH